MISPATQPQQADQEKVQGHQAGRGQQSPSTPAGHGGTSSNPSAGHDDIQIQEILKLLPSFVVELTHHAARQWSMEPSVVLISCLQVLAAANGAAQRLQYGPACLSALFNIISCVSDGMSGNIFEHLASPLLKASRRASQRPHAMSRKILEEEERKLRKLEAMPIGLVGRPAPYQLDQHILNNQQLLRPVISAYSSSAKRLTSLLDHSFDRCVVSLGNQPGAVALDAPGAKANLHDLGEMLWLSWKGLELPNSSGIPCPGVVHLCWQMTPKNLAALMYASRSPWKKCRPPVFIAYHGSSAGQLAPLEEPTFGEWSRHVEALHSIRSKTLMPLVWSLSAESAQRFHGYCCESEKVAYPSESTTQQIVPAIILKLALLLSILDVFTQEDKPDEFVVSDSTMEKACKIALWLSQEHSRTCDSLRDAVNAIGAELGHGGVDSIDNAEVDDAILDCIKRKGPLSRREICRSFHQLSYRTRDRALDRLLKKKSVTECPSGLLHSCTV